MAFRDEFLSTIRALSATLASKFAELKDDIKQLSVLVTDLKIDNSKLRHNVDQLNCKVVILESSKTHIQPSSVVLIAVRKGFSSKLIKISVYNFSISLYRLFLAL
jgi:hypothetical protein